jgi:hypothetical protein
MFKAIFYYFFPNELITSYFHGHFMHGYKPVGKSMNGKSDFVQVTVLEGKPIR